MRRPSVIALIAISIVFVASTLPVNARSSAAEETPLLTVIALDEGVAFAPTDLAMAETALMTLVGGISEGTVAIIRYGDQVAAPVTADAGAGAVRLARTELAKLGGDAIPGRSDQFAVLTSAFSYMTRIDAPSGSRVFMITPGGILGESENTRARLRSVGELYANDGWLINVSTLGSTESALRDLMAELPASSAGSYFDLGTPEGLIALLFEASGVDLTTVVDTELTGTKVTSTFELAPLTDSVSVAFLRFDADAEVALFRPNGAKVTEALANVAIVESPNVVIFNIDGPAAGSWTVEGSGARGKLITAVDARTQLSVELLDQPPAPVGEPGILMAAARIGGEPQAIPGARIVATVAQPDGFTNVYELNDEGLAGDQTAGDGVFSIRLPASEANGISNVALVMSWDNLNAVITGEGSYKTEVFPALRVTRVFDINAHEGETAILATIETFVGEFPYLVSPSAFDITIMGIDGRFDGVAVPRSEPEPGKAFAFDIHAVVPASGDYSIAVTLNTEYLGRAYSAAGPAISSSAVITPQPFLILGLPVWAWSAIGVVAVLGLIVVVVQSRKVQPFGYLYDDQDRLVADFSNLRRSWRRRLLSTDRVKAMEISNLPFKGGVFRFTRSGARLEYRREAGDPSMRVNSRPAGPVIDLSDDVWLGVGGNLLYFSDERRARTGPGFAFSPADD